MARTALILGASGRFGGAMADALWQAGWELRLFDRATDDLMTKAQGVDIIVHGWNPSYDNWARDIPGQTAEIVEAAQASGARVIYPGNIYVYGETSDAALSAQTLHAATNPLGQLRREAETALKTSGIDLLIVRAGDYIDTEASGNWFDRIIAKPLDKGRIDYPGDPTIPHAWAFLPDLARATVMLLEGDLANQEEVLFPGYTLSGAQMAEALGSVTGQQVKVGRAPWLLFRLLSWPMPFMRGMLEMRYLWNKPHWIDPTQFCARLPNFCSTPLCEALAQTAPVKAKATKRQPKQGRGATPSQPRNRAQAT